MDHESFLYYLPYSAEDERLGMVCTTAGDMIVKPYSDYPPYKNSHPAAFRTVAEGRVLPEFQIVYISEGMGSFSAAGKQYPVKAGSLLLILPGMQHAYKPLYETGWHEYWVGFTGGFFFSLLEKGILAPERVFFEMGMRDCIALIFNHIFDEVRSQKPLYQFKACAAIFSLISEIISYERRKEQPSYHQRIVEKAKCLMEAHIFGSISVSSIALRTGMSASGLNKIFKTYTSMTLYQYYIQIKINKAKELLEQADLSIKEIAAKLGFDDQYYFSRLFKNKTGIAPSKWREFIYPDI
jgi:AraC-like DNA-binding protein